MNYNEETMFLLNELEKFGLSREDVEKELSYSPNYIGQLVSRQTLNEKIVTALKMLLRIKVLEKELGYTAEVPKAPNKEDDLKEVVSILKDIHASLNATRQMDELNQCLLKTSILQSAKVESIVAKKDLGLIVERLNKATEDNFDDIHSNPFRKNKAHSVDA